jgi:cell division protein FtsB
VEATHYGDLRARRDATIWQRMNHVLRVLLFLAAWLLIISFFLPPYKKLTQSRAEIEQLQAQVMEEKALLARQTREVTLLKADPTYLETIARDKLDLMKEGETIFRLEARRPETQLPFRPQP